MPRVSIYFAWNRLIGLGNLGSSNYGVVETVNTSNEQFWYIYSLRQVAQKFLQLWSQQKLCDNLTRKRWHNVTESTHQSGLTLSKYSTVSQVITRYGLGINLSIFCSGNVCHLRHNESYLLQHAQYYCALRSYMCVGYALQLRIHNHSSFVLILNAFHSSPNFLKADRQILNIVCHYCVPVQLISYTVIESYPTSRSSFKVQTITSIIWSLCH